MSASSSSDSGSSAPPSSCRRRRRRARRPPPLRLVVVILGRIVVRWFVVVVGAARRSRPPVVLLRADACRVRRPAASLSTSANPSTFAASLLDDVGPLPTLAARRGGNRWTPLHDARPEPARARPARRQRRRSVARLQPRSRLPRWRRPAGSRRMRSCGGSLAVLLVVAAGWIATREAPVPGIDVVVDDPRPAPRHRTHAVRSRNPTGDRGARRRADDPGTVVGQTAGLGGATWRDADRRPVGGPHRHRRRSRIGPRSPCGPADGAVSQLVRAGDGGRTCWPVDSGGAVTRVATWATVLAVLTDGPRARRSAADRAVRAGRRSRSGQRGDAGRADRAAVRLTSFQTFTVGHRWSDRVHVAAATAAAAPQEWLVCTTGSPRVMETTSSSDSAPAP